MPTSWFLTGSQTGWPQTRTQRISPLFVKVRTSVTTWRFARSASMSRASCSRSSGWSAASQPPRAMYSS